MKVFSHSAARKYDMNAAYGSVNLCTLTCKKTILKTSHIVSFTERANYSNLNESWGLL